MSSYDGWRDTYDNWKSTEPEDPWADEMERERRDQEMEPDEPNSYCPTCGWQGMRNEPQFCACPECKTFPLQSSSKLVEMEPDEPEFDWSELNDEPSNINIITGEVEE